MSIIHNYRNFYISVIFIKRWSIKFIFDFYISIC